MGRAEGLRPGAVRRDLQRPFSTCPALTNGLLSGGLLDILENLPLLDILKTGGGTYGGLVGLFGKLTSSLPILNNIL